MAERIEFVGNPLPTGLPGFGGGTVSVLTLPGFNTVVAVQQFGPVVDAPTVTPPNPEPPPGSNPENPTPTPDPVPPAPAPPSGSGGGYIPNLCKQCVTEPNYGDTPLIKGRREKDYCVPCGGAKPIEVNRYFTEPAATSQNFGVYHGGASVLRGKESDLQWSIDANTFKGLQIGEPESDESCTLTRFKVTVGKTEYRTGAIIYDGETTETYEPQELEVCENNETKTWKVLAYKPK